MSHNYFLKNHSGCCSASCFFLSSSATVTAVKEDPELLRPPEADLQETTQVAATQGNNFRDSLPQGSFAYCRSSPIYPNKERVTP